MADEKLKAKLELHKKRLHGEPGGDQLDLSDVNLSRANLSRANLIGANLSDVNLIEANLSDVNLSRANLSRANLSRANLIGANLIGANLIGAALVGADLTWANLTGANLSEADLRRATGNMVEIKSMQIDTYPLVWWWNGERQQLAIGCQSHPVEAWKSFSDAEIRAMDGTKALAWWRKWKKIALEIVEMSPAVR